jgi:DNA-binding beta-propeller fold protein YncE
VDETSLRVQLERALSDEPPLGNVVRNSVRAGRKLRRRRRTGVVAVSAAAVAAVVAVPTVILGAGKPAPAAAPPAARTAYVTGNDTVVPVSLATNSVGESITVPVVGIITAAATAAATPDGRTVYQLGMTNGYSVADGVVTPIDTATNAAGPGIPLPSVPLGIAIEPNGTTAYVATDGGVYPISLATRTVGKLIRISASTRTMAFTPNGQTLYVVAPIPDLGPHGRPVYRTGVVVPIRTATNTALAPITLPKHTGGFLFDIAITPNGETAYVVAGAGGKAYSSSVIPIDTATNTTLAPIRLKAWGEALSVVISPSGGTAYVLTPRAVTPINTTTNKAGPPIYLPDSIGYASDIALTPNGRTIYVLASRGVIPIRTAGRRVLPMIIVPRLQPFTDAYITPDGNTVYVDTATGVVPISTATNEAGGVVNIGAPGATVVFAR